MDAYFTALAANSVITAMTNDTTIAFARDEDAVAMPLDVAVEIAAETLRLLLDDHQLCDHRDESLSNYLGQSDGTELRRILSRIAGPNRPTFTNC